MAARFVASAPEAHLLPELGLAEVAFAGRSNVGKSSLLGAVLGQPKLLRTSKTPGQTRSLNLFVIDERLALVDLPGYGYAKMSRGGRQELSAMIRDYVTKRRPCRGIVLLADARREEVSPLDQAMVRYATEVGRPLLVCVTKSDLVPKTRRKHVIGLIESQLGVPTGAAIACSSKTGEGVQELVKDLWELVRQ